MKSLRILVVDDEEFIREMIRQHLAAAGHEVETAQNGKDALDAMENRTMYDVVLTDVMMPVMDGFAVLEAAKARPIETEVILMTGFGTMEGAEAARQRGAAYYLCKPFQSEELLLCLERIAEKKAETF